MNILGTFVAFAIVASMAGCASKTVKRDPYAEAAKRKNAEIARLTSQIDSLSRRADVAFLRVQIDSLEAVRAIAQASLGGINGVVAEERKRQQDNLKGAGLIAPPSDSAMNKEYPIKRP
ncbi:MAG: hypothetical protein RL173_3572 [Fibrobacterota bacterium]|jgi:outer membrane murein-binding lipoprotein Lpp